MVFKSLHLIDTNLNGNLTKQLNLSIRIPCDMFKYIIFHLKSPLTI